MAALDLMTPDGPKAKLFLNMNTIYIRLDNNLSCFEVFPTSLKIAYTALENGVPVPNIDYQSYIIPTYELSYLTEGEEVGLPDFNYKIEILNYEYKIEFTFIYEFLGNPDTVTDFYSTTTQYLINNTTPTIYSGVTSYLVQSSLTRDLTARNTLKIFFDAPEPIVPEVNDIKVTLGGLSIMCVNRIVNGTPSLGNPDEYRVGLARYITEHPAISRIVKQFSPVGPGPDEIIFNLNFNKSRYICTLYGDLTKLRG